MLLAFSHFAILSCSIPLFRWRPWRPQHPFLRSTRIFGLMRRSRSFGSLGRITGRFENQSFNARWDEYPRRWTRNSNSDPKSPLCWTTNIDQHSDGCFLWCLKTKLYNMYIYIYIHIQYPNISRWIRLYWIPWKSILFILRMVTRVTPWALGFAP